MGDGDYPRPVTVTTPDGRHHNGWVRAARRDEQTGRWRGFVDYIDADDIVTGGHYIHWVDEDRIAPR